MNHAEIVTGLAFVGAVSIAIIGIWLAFCIAAWCENWLARRQMLTDHANSARNEINALWKRVEFLESITKELSDSKTK